MLSAVRVVFVVMYGVVLPLLVFVICCADVNGRGWLGRVSRALLHDNPRMFRRVAKAVCGNTCYSVLGRCVNHTLNERNHLLQGLYLLLINGAFIWWLVHGHPRIPTRFVSETHSNVAFALLLLCHMSFITACSRSAGVVSARNQECFAKAFPYDEVIFSANTMCSTCKVLKPARSKHCTLCDACVPRFDHHCVWLNACVGELNYRFFLLFLAVHLVFFGFGSWIVFSVMASETYERDLFNATFVTQTGEQLQATTLLVVSHVIRQEVALFSLLVFALAFFLAIAGFLSYHLYLVAMGTTTNESFKWRDLRTAYARAVDRQARGEEPAGEAPGESTEPPEPSTAAPRDDDSDYGELVVPLGALPRNAYDKGFVANMREVLFPPSLRFLAESGLTGVDDDDLPKTKED